MMYRLTRKKRSQPAGWEVMAPSGVRVRFRGAEVKSSSEDLSEWVKCGLLEVVPVRKVVAAAKKALKPKPAPAPKVTKPVESVVVSESTPEAKPKPKRTRKRK